MSGRALILGTLAGQTDAIRTLQADGWTVFACGHERIGSGVDAADEFFLTDILAEDDVTELAERLEVDLVYSVGSDVAMPTVARVSERLGLPSFHDVETTETLHRKGLLRRFLTENGLSPVTHVTVRDERDLDDFQDFPAIMKPTDSQAQRGIAVVRSRDEAAAALGDALGFSRSGTAIVEEYLQGPEVSVHVVVVDGEVRFHLPSDRHVWDGPLVGIPTAHTVPAHFLDEDSARAVRGLVREVVSALGVRSGPLYFQLIITSDGPRIVEIAPRLDGCHLWRLIEVHTGFNLMSALFRLLSDGVWTPPEPWSDDRTHTLRFHLSSPAEPFTPEDHSVAEFGTVLFEEFHVEPGERPRSVNGVVARVGYAITEDHAR